MFISLRRALSCWLLLALAALMPQHLNAQDMTQNLALTPQQQSLSAIAGLEAKGDLKRLYQAIDEGLDRGLTVAQIKEALSQLYAYTGFPRSLNSLGQLQQVIADRKQAGKDVAMGEDDKTVLPKNFDSLKTGTEVQTKLSGRPFDYTFAPRTDYYLKAHLFGDIFAGQALTHAEREIVTVSAIANLPGCEPQLGSHCRGALNMGVSEAQLQDIPAVLEAKVDAAAARRTRAAIAQLLGKSYADDQLPKKGIEDSPYPVGQFNSAYAQYFDGKSYLAPLDAQNGGPVNVTFEPGCRNHWHVHHKGVQVLICVAGRGWYQEWGKPAVEMTPGTVIVIPAEAKHWHGAAKDSWFQHLTYHTKVEEGASNEWLEAVDAEEYNKLP